MAAPGPGHSTRQPLSPEGWPGHIPILIMPMPNEREKLVRDIDGLKERIRLAWLDMISSPMAPAERQELRRSIESLVRELDNLRTRLDQAPKAEA